MTCHRHKRNKLPFFPLTTHSTQTFSGIFLSTTANQLATHCIKQPLIPSSKMPSASSKPSTLSPSAAAAAAAGERRNVVGKSNPYPISAHPRKQADQTPPHRPLLRPPSQRKSHHQNLQADLRHISSPFLPNRRHHFRSLAKSAPPQAQIPHPRILNSCLWPTNWTRECPHNLQRYCA